MFALTLRDGFLRAPGQNEKHLVPRVAAAAWKLYRSPVFSFGCLPIPVITVEHGSKHEVRVCDAFVQLQTLAGQRLYLGHKLLRRRRTGTRELVIHNGHRCVGSSKVRFLLGCVFEVSDSRPDSLLTLTFSRNMDTPEKILVGFWIHMPRVFQERSLLRR